MRKLKKFSILLIIALTVISFFCPIMAYAEEESPAPEPTPTPVPTPAPSDLDKMQEELDKIYDYLDSLSNKQAPAPTYPPEPTEKPVAAPLVKVLSPQTITLYAGSITDTEITLKNVGTSHASSVLTQATTTAGDPGFTMTFLNGSNSISSIGQNSETNVLLRFITDKTAKPGTYTIEITNSFRDMYGANLTEKDSINVKVENSGYGAGMFLKDFSSSSDSITPGSTFTLSLKLINGSPFDMTGARIEIEGIKPEGINMTGTSGVFRSSVPSGHEETLSYQFSAAKKAREGSYPLTFTLNYNDSSGEQRSTAYTYYVRVVSAGDTDDEQGTANVEIVSLESPSGIFGVGETFGVELSIRNTGDAAARRVSVKADGGEAIMPVSASIKLVNRLPAGESETMQFYFAASKAAKSQYHMIHFTLSYETGNYETDKTAENDTSISNETITVDQYAGVNVYNPPEPSQTPEPSPDPAKINKPKMIVSSYKTDPAIVSAGKSFKLSLDFQNTHKTKIVSNLKIVITATESSGEAGSIFSPLDSGNTVFISEIPPGGIVNKTMTMITAPDAKPRSYALSVKFVYQDDEFLEHEEEEQIGITVKQAIRLEISDLVLPSDGFVGEPLMLYCNIINSGWASLGNLRVRVESEELDTAGAGAYMGTLMEGSSTYYEGMVTPLTSGAVKGVLIVSGEDASGETTELRQDFEVQIQDYSMDMGMELDNMEMLPKPVEMGLFEKLQAFLTQYWMWAAAGAVLFMVIIVIILKIVKNRRKQRSWETNE